MVDFIDNSAFGAVAIFNYNYDNNYSNLTINDSSFINNPVDYMEGAIYNQETCILNINGPNFIDNFAKNMMAQFIILLR